MSWLKVALGLLSTAVGTEAGREVIRDVSSAIRKETPRTQAGPQGPSIDAVQSLISQHREEVDRNIDAVVQMLNLQNQKLEQLVRMQMKWNIALAAGLVIVAAVAFLT